MPPAQTIKQAKASFAARGRPSLNPQEQRQLERGLELELRAERAQESEKRRAAAARKRVEQEGKSGRNRERERALLGTQRRRDRFGYVSSQFHLGAFLKRKEVVVLEKEEQKEVEEVMVEEVMVEEVMVEEVMVEEVMVEEVMVEEDVFGDDDLDDEVMLNALDDAPPAQQHSKSDSAVHIPVLVPPTLQRSQSTSVMEDLMDDFWDDMESSTQIARELSLDEMNPNVVLEVETTGQTTSTRSASFGSVDFDLTAEDLDHLDPPRKEESMPVANKVVLLPPPVEKNVLPPPAVLSRQATRTVQIPTQTRASIPTMQSPHSTTSTTMMPPPLKSTSVMPPPAKSVSKMRPPMRPTVGPQFSKPQDSKVPPPVRAIVRPQYPNPQVSNPTIPPPPRKFQNPTPHQTKSRNAIKGPFLPASSLYCSPDLGFTLTQLESFVDDDIQLTQAMPG